MLHILLVAHKFIYHKQEFFYSFELNSTVHKHNIRWSNDLHVPLINENYGKVSK